MFNDRTWCLCRFRNCKLGWPSPSETSVCLHMCSDRWREVIFPWVPADVRFHLVAPESTVPNPNGNQAFKRRKMCQLDFLMAPNWRAREVTSLLMTSREMEEVWSLQPTRHPPSCITTVDSITIWWPGDNVKEPFSNIPAHQPAYTSLRQKLKDKREVGTQGTPHPSNSKWISFKIQNSF